jgi:hypothetical protein
MPDANGEFATKTQGFNSDPTKTGWLKFKFTDGKQYRITKVEYKSRNSGNDRTDSIIAKGDVQNEYEFKTPSTDVVADLSSADVFGTEITFYATHPSDRNINWGAQDVKVYGCECPSNVCPTPPPTKAPTKSPTMPTSSPTLPTSAPTLTPTKDGYVPGGNFKDPDLYGLHSIYDANGGCGADGVDPKEVWGRGRPDDPNAYPPNVGSSFSFRPMGVKMKDLGGLQGAPDWEGTGIPATQGANTMLMKDGTIVLLYKDVSTNKLSCTKLVKDEAAVDTYGYRWEHIGPQGFSPTVLNAEVRAVMSSTDEPVVFFSTNDASYRTDGSTGGTGTVMKYDAANDEWKGVGPKDCTYNVSPGNMGIALHPKTDNVYIIYQEGLGGASVRYLNPEKKFWELLAMDDRDKPGETADPANFGKV